MMLLRTEHPTLRSAPGALKLPPDYSKNRHFQGDCCGSHLVDVGRSAR